MKEIHSYVFCETCHCTIHEWAVYAWHVDRNHRIIWPSQEREAK